MKLTLPQLEPHLAKTLAPIYIVSSDDLIQKQEAISTIRKAVKKAQYEERIRLTPEAGFDWDQLYSLLYSQSLLAEKRLIELDFRDIGPNKVASTILKDYAEKPSPDTILLIDLGKLDDKISRSAWYKALEKMGMVIQIWPMTRDQLPTWIMQRARRYKLTIAPEAAALLADYVEGNLVAAAQALEKLYLLRATTTITTEMVQEVLSDESLFSIFDFVDSLVSSNTARTLHILQSLKENGVEPILILWGITRELRTLADFAIQLTQGVGFDQLCQKQRIFSKRQPLIRKFLNRFTADHCWHSLSQAMEIDRMIKGANPGNAWEALEMFCLRFG
jgi:DNA polymerase-3 subunit delta